MKNTIIAALRRILGASYVSMHDRAKDESPERRGVGPFKHRAGRIGATWDRPAPLNKGARTEVDVEWSIFYRGHSWIGAGVETDAGKVKVKFGFAIGAFWVHIERWPEYRDLPHRELTVDYTLPGPIVDGWGRFGWRFGCDPHEWNSKTPKWRDGSFYPYEALMRGLFGRERCEKATLSTHAVMVPMPEGSYAATVTIDERTWTRARIPWPTQVRRSASIDIEKGIPVPGKGENSWDCGDDAIFGTGSNEPSIAAAIGAAVRAATETRLRHGGPDWRPPASREAVPS